MALLSSPARWYASPRLQKLGLLILVVGTGVQLFLTLRKPNNDFTVHQQVGRDFLAGRPYALGQEMYPLGRTMMDCLFILEPPAAARAATFALALAGLIASFWIWRRLARSNAGVPASAGLQLDRAAAILTVLLFLPYLSRDLDECGMHLLVLFTLSAGAYALYCGRPAWSGLFLATAATFKVAPVLFFPFLLWKRQFRAAVWMVVFILAWAAAPALHLGWDATLRFHAQYLDRTAKIMANQDAYPSTAGIEPPKPQNLSLQAAIARYLETYPPGHPLHLDHAWFVQFGNFDGHTAYMLVRGVLLGLGLCLAWRFRRSWAGASGADENFASEWAAVCLLTATLSPICWKQHLVLALPSGFLVVRSLLQPPRVSPVRLLALVLIAAVVLLARHGVVGRDLAIVLNSYKIDTFAMLLLLALVLTLPRGSAATFARAASPVPLPNRLAA